MIYKRQIRKWGDSYVFAIPLDLAKYLELEEGTNINIKDENKKKGKFIAVWKVHS